MAAITIAETIGRTVIAAFSLFARQEVAGQR